ncbi:MAG: hypothetical protein IJT34_05040 [Butyrivibrio sp.]|nr:hypothetical protein [Butyrivibrio sp.]
MNYDIVEDEAPESEETPPEEPEEESSLSKEDEKRLQEARDRQVERDNLRRKLKLITPAVMLAAGAIVSIYTFLREYLLGDFLVIVFGTLLLFFGIGLLIEYLVVHFVHVNWMKEDIRRDERMRVQAEEERRRLAEEEARRLEEEEAGRLEEEAAAQTGGELSDEDLAAYEEGLGMDLDGLDA